MLNPSRKRFLIQAHRWIALALAPLFLLILLSGAVLAFKPILHAAGDGAEAATTVAGPAAVAALLERVDPEGRARSVEILADGLVSIADIGVYIVSDAGVSALDRSGNWPKTLHEGTWAGAWSGTLNLVGAIGLTGLTLTGFLSWYRRRRQATARSGDADADILVAHASQTGTAARLAEATATALRRGGERVALASLGALNPGELHRYRHVLLLVSTTGEGEVPDPGRGFLARLATTRLDGVRFALLALGDSRYARFCGGGEALLGALVTAGAEPALPMRLVDRAPAVPWRSWLDSLSTTLGIRPGVPPVVDEDRPLTVRLRERTRVTPGEIRLSVGLVELADAAGGARLGAASGLLCRTLAVGESLAVRLRRHPAFNPRRTPGGRSSWWPPAAASPPSRASSTSSRRTPAAAPPGSSSATAGAAATISTAGGWRRCTPAAS